MNKLIRKNLVVRHRKRNIKNFISKCDIYINSDGEQINNPIVSDIKKGELTAFTHQRKPCSCGCCSPYKFKRERLGIILNIDITHLCYAELNSRELELEYL